MRATDAIEMGRGPGSRTLTRNARDRSAVGAYWLLETELNMLIAERTRPDRAPQMPMLGLLSGLGLALVLWSGIAWLVLNVLG
jgi:hypothetical protein